jgi:DNA-binding SARP family transcriptional activator/tetratricopeptide (TPR) repeat protein
LPVEFRVLGEVQAWHDGCRVPLGQPQARLLLALLLLEPNRLVPVDRLIDMMWGTDPPATARGGLHNRVAGLRAALAVGGVRIVTRRPGYVLEIDPEQVDAHVFTEQVAVARRVEDPGARASGLGRALALWRGPIMVDVIDLVDDTARSGLAAGFGELRLAAVEERAEALLECGGHDRMIDELIVAAEQNPTRERLIGALMVALARAGRLGESLALFRRTRERLDVDLGLRPGRDLSDLHDDLLRDEPTTARYRPPQIPVSDAEPVAATAEIMPRARPAQLPLVSRGFSGRVAELDRLNAMVAADADADTVTVVVISGMGGVGKTALALFWAHRIAERYRDGQIFLDLRGHSEDDPIPPVEALAAMLQALGLTPEQIPADLTAAVGLFRTTVADRQLLILLDNAHSADQIRPLLPGGGGCLVVITSRHRLGDMRVHHGAWAMDLDALGSAAAEHLLTELLARTQREPALITEIAELCAYLPLALRIVAARLGEQPERGIAWLRDELAGDDRLAVLRIDGDGVAVRAAFDLSYRLLPADTRHLFNHLGLLPVAEFSVGAVAALAGRTITEIRRGLGDLTAAHMVRIRADGRYDIHDLIQTYAQSLAVDLPDRTAAYDRLYTWFFRGASAAAELLYPRLSESPRTDPQRWLSTSGPDPPDTGTAQRWLDEEFTALAAAIRRGARNGQAEATIEIAYALRGYLLTHATLADWLPITEAAMNAAHTLGDTRSEAAAHSHAGIAYAFRDVYQQAVRHLERARDLAEHAGWTHGVLIAEQNLGVVYLMIGELALAHALIVRVIEALTRSSEEAQVIGAMLNLGQLLIDMGRPAEAIEVITQAFDRADRYAVSWASSPVPFDTLGLAYHHTGQHQLARKHLSNSVRLARSIGDRSTEAVALAHLAIVASDQGHAAEASDLVQQAISSAALCGRASIEVSTLNAAAVLHIRAGRTAEGINAATRAYDLARTVGVRESEIAALINLALAHRVSGEVHVVAKLAEQAKGQAEASGFAGRARQAADILAGLG